MQAAECAGAEAHTDQAVALAPRASCTRIHQVGIFSSARLTGAVALVCGLVLGAGVAALAMGWSAVDTRGAGAGGDAERSAAAIFGVVVVLVSPLAFAACGWVCGLLAGVLYNLFARLTGGLEVDFS
jgi:hypothetical protein